MEAKAGPSLRYHSRSFLLALFYVPLLVVPWVLTCILRQRPIGLPTYYNQTGEYGVDVLEGIRRWMLALRVLDAVLSVLTIPIISALLAHAAVISSQRRSVRQSKSLRQIFALADRGWADIFILGGAASGDGTSSVFIWFAAAFLLLSAVQAPLRQALVTTETFPIMACSNNPMFVVSKDCGEGFGWNQAVNYDPEPWSLANAPQSVVVPNVIAKLASVNEDDFQVHLWHDDVDGIGNIAEDEVYASNTLDFYVEGVSGPSFFVSAMVNNTQTGILREHAMRINSTAECSAIDMSAFPSACPGALPFTSSYYRNGDTSVDICAPGNYTAYPWNLTRDRQDIYEDLYIKVVVDGNSPNPSFALHCASHSTRGYFELGNIRSNNTAGPLLAQWPSNETLWLDFNDYLALEAQSESRFIPGNNDSYGGTGPKLSWQPGATLYPYSSPTEAFGPSTPGPLMTSVLAMFGNNSFFQMASDPSLPGGPLLSICQANNVPFTGTAAMWEVSGQLLNLCDNYYGYGGDAAEEISQFEELFFYPWIQQFAKGNGKKLLQIAMFVSSETLLLNTQTVTGSVSVARAIYTSPGTPITRPLIASRDVVVINALISLELLGLAILLIYIYSAPSWTAKFNSLAVAQLVVSTGQEKAIPPVRLVKNTDRRKLKEIEGLVGVSEEMLLQEHPQSTDVHGEGSSLARGGKQPIPTWWRTAGSSGTFRLRRTKRVDNALMKEHSDSKLASSSLEEVTEGDIENTF